MINFAICSTSQNFTIFNLILWVLAGIGLISIFLFLINKFQSTPSSLEQVMDSFNTGEPR
jgi:hypothetical protein